METKKFRMNRMEINTVRDYNDVCNDLLDEYLEDFKEIKGMTRSPEEEDLITFDGREVQFVYTQAGMRLYDSACKKLKRLGEKAFPEDSFDLDIKAGTMMIMP